MPSTRLDPFAHALETSRSWLDSVAEQLQTHDHHAAMRAVRAWLHLVRDRLPVDNAAKLAAQLPGMLRGVYFEGWEPSQVPIKYDAREFLNRFAREARIRVPDVPPIAAAVSAAMARRLAPGELAEIFALFPPRLRGLLTDESLSRVDGTTATPLGRTPESSTGVEERISRQEARMATVTDAVEVLAHGLRDSAQGALAEDTTARAGRLAAEILLTQRV